jgi:hypothetical protein
MLAGVLEKQIFTRGFIPVFVGFIGNKVPQNYPQIYAQM